VRGDPSLRLKNGCGQDDAAYLAPSIDLSFYHAGVIPKARVFSSGARDLPLSRCCRLVFIAPIFRQVLPTRIHRFDKLALLAPAPAFDFLFATDGGVRIEEAFEVNKAGQIVSAGKAGYEFVLVLPAGGGP